MLYYPINLNIRNKQCLVIGGGKVAERKVETLLSCGAKVKIVSPELTEGLRKILTEEEVTYAERGYRGGDLEGVFLVVACTDDREVNVAVSNEAQGKNILCNVVDKPDLCNFIVPSIVSRGDLMITISTAGKSPALAKRLRRELEERYGEEYEHLLKIMGAIRPKVLARNKPQSENEVVFNQIVNSELLDLIRAKDYARIDNLLEEVLGPGSGLSDLGIRLH